MRGLKPLLKYRYRTGTKVASFTDAWIETIERRKLYGGVRVASFTDAWIETPNPKRKLTMMLVASFTDAWIETKTCYIFVPS